MIWTAVVLLLVIVVVVVFASRQAIPRLVLSGAIPDELTNVTVQSKDCAVCSKTVGNTTRTSLPLLKYGQEHAAMLPDNMLVTSVRVQSSSAPRLIAAPKEVSLYNFSLKHARKPTTVEFTLDAETGVWVANADLLNTAELSMVVYAQGVAQMDILATTPPPDVAAFLKKYNVHARFGPLALVGSTWVVLDCPALPCRITIPCKNACDLVPQQGTPMAGAQIGFFRLSLLNMAVKDVVVFSTGKPSVVTSQNVYIDVKFEQVQPGEWHLQADYIGNGAVITVNAADNEEVRYNATKIEGMTHMAQHDNRFYHLNAWYPCDC